MADKIPIDNKLKTAGNIAGKNCLLAGFLIIPFSKIKFLMGSYIYSLRTISFNTSLFPEQDILQI